MGEVYFRLPVTNGFHAKAKNKRFTAAGSRCRQNLKNEYFTSLFGRLRQNIARKSVPHVQHDYFSSLYQSNHWFLTLSLPLQSSFLKRPNVGHSNDYVKLGIWSWLIDWLTDWLRKTKQHTLKNNDLPSSAKKQQREITSFAVKRQLYYKTVNSLLQRRSFTKRKRPAISHAAATNDQHGEKPCINVRRIVVTGRKFRFWKNSFSQGLRFRESSLRKMLHWRNVKVASSAEMKAALMYSQVSFIEKFYNFLVVKNSRRKWSVYLKLSWSLKVSSLL